MRVHGKSEDARASRRSPPLLCLAVLCVSCSPSLQAVRTTARLGTSLPSLRATLADAATLCVIGNEANETDPHCAQIEADAQRLQRVVDGTAAYARALGAIADAGRDADDAKDAVAPMEAFAKATDSTAGKASDALAMVAQAVIGLMTDGVRQRDTQAVIVATDEALGRLGSEFDTLFEAHLQAATSVRSQIEETILLENALKQPAARLALLPSLTFVDVTLGHLRRFHAAFAAFVRSHHVLRSHVDKLDDKDVLRRIEDELTALGWRR